LRLGGLALVLTAMAGSLGGGDVDSAASPERWQPQPGERCEVQRCLEAAGLRE